MTDYVPVGDVGSNSLVHQSPADSQFGSQPNKHAMKLWLDDVRTPPGLDWVWVRTSLEAIKALRAGPFEVISLDHDLGEDAGTGYEVLQYIEAEVARNPEYEPPEEIIVHTANNVARARMLQAVASIQRFLSIRG
jgi:hypothetical protein